MPKSRHWRVELTVAEEKQFHAGSMPGIQREVVRLFGREPTHAQWRRFSIGLAPAADFRWRRPVFDRSSAMSAGVGDKRQFEAHGDHSPQVGGSCSPPARDSMIHREGSRSNRSAHSSEQNTYRVPLRLRRAAAPRGGIHIPQTTSCVLPSVGVLLAEEVLRQKTDGCRKCSVR